MDIRIFFVVESYSGVGKKKNLKEYSKYVYFYNLKEEDLVCI